MRPSWFRRFGRGPGRLQKRPVEPSSPGDARVTASTMRQAASTAASIERSVVSSKCASGAWPQRRIGPVHVALVALGDLGLQIVKADRARPGREAPSAAARCGRGETAVTKNFTSASGQITVPMSRPSSTAPAGSAAKARWACRSTARTAGMAATLEAASAGGAGADAALVDGGRDRARWRPRPPLPRSAGSPPRVEHRQPHGAVERAGVEALQPVVLGQAWASVPLPEAVGPSTAMIMDPPLAGHAQLRECADIPLRLA